MWLKILILVLFLANIVALGSALFTLLVDGGRGGKRTANLLFIRVSLALLLLVVVILGILTGHIGIGAPWDSP